VDHPAVSAQEDVMNWHRVVAPVALVAALATMPLSTARAQTPWCNPFPLTWPFCIVGAAATVATAPFRAVAYPYYYPPRYYYRRYPYYGYYAPPYYYGRPY
jgi:hypothetical protein